MLHSEGELLLLLNLTETLPVLHTALASYRVGFIMCAHDVAHFLASCESVSSEMRMFLLAHLDRCLTEMNMVTPSEAVASSAQLSIFNSRTILFPALLANSIYKNMLRNNGRFTPAISRVMHLNTTRQLWRPW